MPKVMSCATPASALVKFTDTTVPLRAVRLRVLNARFRAVTLKVDGPNAGCETWGWEGCGTEVAVGGGGGGTSVAVGSGSSVEVGGTAVLVDSATDVDVADGVESGAVLSLLQAITMMAR